MNTEQQAYINGFVKRASEYGLNHNEAVELLKQSAWEGTGFHGSPVYNMIYGDPNNPKPAAPTRTPSVNVGGLDNVPGSRSRGYNPGAIAAAMSPAAPATPATSNTVLLNAAAPTNTFGGDVQLGLSGKTSPAPLGPPAPAAASAAQGGPSNAYLAKVMGSYNPNSALDQRKANAIRQAYQPGMSANQIYANKGYQAASQRR